MAPLRWPPLVSGVPDIDSFPVEKCHDAVAALLGKAPDSRLKGRVACLAARASGCAAVVAFVAHTQAVQRAARGPV
jgi:hypothetical protein